MSNTPSSIVVFGETPVEEINRPMVPEKLISGDPMHTISNYYLDENSQLRAGVWASTAGKWHAFSGRNEFCHMLSGVVKLTDSDGSSKTFITGDSFLITPAFDGTWEVIEDAKKLYVIFEPIEVYSE